MYKVVQIWPGQTVTCLHTNSPGHIWTTLYNLNYAKTTMGVQSWRENISRGTRMKNIEYDWHNAMPPVLKMQEKSMAACLIHS